MVRNYKHKSPKNKWPDEQLAAALQKLRIGKEPSVSTQQLKNMEFPGQLSMIIIKISLQNGIEANQQC